MLGYCRYIMKHFIPVIAILALVFSVGCTNRNTTETHNSATDKNIGGGENGARWYYFSDTGIHPAQNPSEIPARSFVAWTEAVRVADAAIINKGPAFLINRLGLMTSGSSGESPALHVDASLFSGNTADGLYNTGKETVIRLYRNSFFSQAENRNSKEGSVFLAQYKNETGSFSVSLSATDLGLPQNAQCVALDRIGSMWYASFKYEQDSKVQFSYLEFESFPEQKSGSFDLSGIKKISSDTYQKSVAPFSLEDAPDSLKSIVKGIPTTTGLTIRVYSPVSRSAQTYVRTGNAETTSVEGSAFVSEEKTAVLFADGTFYFNPDNSSSKVLLLHFPVLSNGYVYTHFIFSGKTVLAAWEEQRFFETGRAGILEINLNDAVY